MTNLAQSDERLTSSGLRCLVIVGRHHGVHFTLPQLIRDNLLGQDEPSTAELVKCASGRELRAKAVRLNWQGVVALKKALPAIVRLKNGNSMVLLRTEANAESARVVLQDPNAETGALLVIDRARLEEVWTSEVVLVKRNYDIADETQPFSLAFILALLFRERRLVRDIAISALALGFLALTPIIFWRLLSDRVLTYHSMNTFVVLSIIMAILIVFEAIFAALRRHLLLHLIARSDVKLATYMFDKVLNLPIDYFERTATGLIARDMNEIWRIRTFLTGQMFGTILDAVILLIFLPVMFAYSPLLTTIVVAFCVIIFLWILVMLPAYRRKSAAVVAAEGARGSFMIQSLQGIRTIKSLALEERQRRQWDVHVARIAKLRLAEGSTANLVESIAQPLERFMVSGTFALGVYIAVTTNDPVYIGALFAFLLLSQRIASPLVKLAKLMNQLDEVQSAIVVVANLVNQPEEEGRSGHGVRTPITGHVAFSNVRFKYNGSLSPALSAVSFEAPSGATLGIMGRSGSGKTTVTRLLQRLHSDYQGLIKIDGIDVREFDIGHLRTSLGVVLQENFLFSGTIRENITAAKSDATFEEMVHAARLAGAEEFIDRLPRGYETYIYEGSPNLSGGQKQRLAIARALITDPKILILDEATSALDAESEAIVNANLRRIAHGRTMIVISHRLSSLVSADAILVLERGCVHDIGRHHELLARCDIYSGLWHQQNGHVQDAHDASQLRGPSAA